MKTKLILLVLSLYSFYGFAQITGLSAGKLGSFCANTTGIHTLEIEGGFATNWQKGYWDINGDKINFYNNNDSLIINSSGYLRTTYGISEKSEFGSTIDLSGNSIGFGYKNRFLENDKTNVALMAGLNFNNLKSNYTTNKYFKENLGLGLGLITSISIKENLSWDVNIQYFSGLNSNTGCFYLTSDIGYYPHENLQLIAGINYSNNFINNDMMSQMKTGIITGFSYEKSENFVIIFNYNSALAGVNNYTTGGLGLAVMFYID